ncbi:MAG: prolyl oligopeptidase family serine peptidase, partial [Acidobacteria bacterium]|nr:prolyl oligopeptidase family serine peptidase [Acidobacteriota bacterium]
RPDEPPSLRAWRYRLDHDDDIAAEFTHRAIKALNHLVASRFTDPAKVAAFGTSRGGFMALHFAAVDPRVRFVAGFAPVTDLLMLTEFAGMQDERPARALSTLRLADRLADRAIWIAIGSTDNRVSTARAIEFTSRIIEAATARGLQPKIELHVRPSPGHTTPAGSYGAAARWVVDLWR